MYRRRVERRLSGQGATGRIKRMRVLQGFTLIEMMVVVAIAGMLLTIAFNSYSRVLLKSKRSVAVGIMAEIAQLQERLYLTDRSYGELSEFTRFDPADTVGVDASGSVVAAGAGLYDVTMTVASTSAFTIQATAKNSQTDDTTCVTMTLTHDSVRSPADCW